MAKKFDVEKARALGYKDQEIQQFMAQNNLVPKFNVGGFLGNIGRSGGKFVGDIVRSPGALLKTGAGLAKGETKIGDIVKGIGKSYKDRYGGWDEIARTMYFDPVGVAGDVSTVLGGAGAGVKALGLSDDIARGLATASRATNPLNMVGAAGKGVAGITTKGIRKAGKNISSFAEDLPTRGMGNPAKLKTAKGILGSTNQTMADLFKKYNIKGRTAEEFYRAAKQAGGLSDEAVMASKGVIETGELAKSIQSKIAELSPLANSGSKDAIRAIEELQNRLNSLIVKQSGGASYSPLQTNVSDILSAKKAAYYDMPKGAFAQSMANPGTSQGIQDFYRSMIGATDKIAPGTQNLGREQSALLKLADIAGSGDARGSARMLANPIDIATTVGSYSAGGLPGIAAKYAAQTLMNDPRALTYGSKALSKVGASLSGFSPNMPSGMAKNIGRGASAANILRASTQGVTPSLGMQQQQRQPSQTTPQQQSQQDTRGLNSSYTNYKSVVKVKPITQNKNPFGKVKKVTRGSFY